MRKFRQPKISREQLYEDYINNNLSFEEIANKYGYQNKTSIRNLLKKYKIKIRPLENSKRKYWKHILTKDFLIEQYITLEKTITDIAKELNSSNFNIIYSYLIKYKIPVRTRGENIDILSKKMEISGEKHHSWTGYKEINGKYFQNIKRNAYKGNKEFNITIEYIWDLFIKQDRKCALSNVELCFPPFAGSKSKRKEQTASLDRIDSNKGYIEGNVQWVHKDINWIKRNLSDQELIDWCHLISDYQRKLNNDNNIS